MYYIHCMYAYMSQLHYIQENLTHTVRIHSCTCRCKYYLNWIYILYTYINIHMYKYDVAYVKYILYIYSLDIMYSTYGYN